MIYGKMCGQFYHVTPALEANAGWELWGTGRVSVYYNKLVNCAVQISCLLWNVLST
jgi:hypothetical protein